MPSHPNARANGRVREHVLVASKALGHALPKGSDVHHVNGDKKDNRPSNLVICQDRAYHFLLHVRQRTIKAGGNPNTDYVCRVCAEAKPFDAFFKDSNCSGTGRGTICRACVKLRDRRQHHRKERANAAIL